MIYTEEYIKQSIKDFRKRVKKDRGFCEKLFEDATIRLLSHKYAYYIESNPYIDDIAYDLEEKGWYIMGRGLDAIDEDTTSPCIDFDRGHPLAQKGIELAKTLMRK